MRRFCLSILFAAALATGTACSQGTSGSDDVLDAFSDATSEVTLDDTVEADAALNDAQDDTLHQDSLSQDLAADIGHDDSHASDATVTPPIEVIGHFKYDFVSTATSQMDSFLTVNDTDRSAVAVNTCNTMGFVFVDRFVDNTFSASLVLSEINLESPPAIDDLVPRRVLLTRTDATAAPAINAMLAYDDCSPMVFVQTETGWDFAVLGDSAPDWTPVDAQNTYSDIEGLGARQGRDGVIHLAFRARPSGGTMRFFDAAFNGTGFDITSYTSPDTAMRTAVDVWFDADGLPVIGYVKVGTEGDEFWVASRTSSDEWKLQQVKGVVPSDLGVSFAIGSYGREGLAWVSAVASNEGILLSAALKYTYRDTDNLFKTETVQVDNDGYRGSNTRFTGGRPILTIDLSGRPHIIYSDIAVRIVGETQVVTHGQIRYAWRRGGTWNQQTIFRQDSPDGEATPVAGGRFIAVNADGTLAGIAATAIVTTNDLNASIDTMGWAVSNAK